MTVLPDDTSPQTLMTQYHAAIGELTDLAERERTHLVRTAARVETVMRALAEQETREKIAELPASRAAAGAPAFRPPMRT